MPCQLTCLLTLCQYTLSVLIPYTVFTNNRFLSPLFLMFKSLVYTSLCTHCPYWWPHTLSLVPLCHCHCLCFAHFDGCVCSIAPLFVFIMHCILHCVLCLCVACLVSVSLHVFISMFLCFSAFLLNFVTMHFVTALYHTLFHFANFVLHLHSLTSAFLGTTELQRHSHFIVARN